MMSNGADGADGATQHTTEAPHEEASVATDDDIDMSESRYSAGGRSRPMKSNYFRIAIVGCLGLLWITFVGAVLGGLIA